MIKKMGIASFLLATLYTSLTPALAQSSSGAKSIWRCGNAYSDKPCHDGKVVDVNDSRSTTDRHAADAATQRTANSAANMERDRLQLERAADERARANAIDYARTKAEQDKAARPKTLSKPPKKHKAKPLPPDYFTAHGADAPTKKPAKVSSK
jgi:hypothetical protein